MADRVLIQVVNNATVASVAGLVFAPGQSAVTQDVTADQPDKFALMAWALNTTYTAGEVVSYDGRLWAAIVGHTVYGDPSWCPGVAWSLWREVWESGVIPEWRQPQGAHDAYPAGFQVTHNGYTYESDIDDNVWEPGVFGWTCLDCPVSAEWAAGVAYTGDNTAGAGNGDVVTYSGAEYRCLQSHTSQVGWTPPVVPALWVAL